MDADDLKLNEGKSVRIILKDGITFFYGTYCITNSETIMVTDRKRNTFPINIFMIGFLYPVDKINYEDGGEKND